VEQCSILLTEYFTSIFNPYECSTKLLAEACGMLFSLIKILKNIDMNIIITLSSYLAKFLKSILKDVYIEVTSEIRYFDQIDILKNSVDYVIAIAPPVQLLTIAEIVKQKLLGPPLMMLKSLSSKFEALNILKRYGINVPNTVMCCENEQCSAIENMTLPIVVKPSMLAGSECVYIVNNKDDVKEFVKKVRECDPMGCAVVQEYISGYHGSISTVIDYGEPLLISLNLQLISIKNNVVEYHGNVLPVRNKISLGKAIDIVDKLRYLKDLNGYIGLDVVWNEKMYVVEVNPRFTTSGIGITEIYPYLGKVLLKKTKPRHRYIADEVSGYAYVVKKQDIVGDFYDICLNGLVYGYTESFNKVLEIVNKVNPYVLENMPYDINSIV
jgi:predicted ATP-grasp superfamily ATP-dependent carboligase